MGEKKSACRVMMGLPEGTKPLRRCRHPMADDINLDPEDIGLEVIDSTNVAQDRCK